MWPCTTDHGRSAALDGCPKGHLWANQTHKNAEASGLGISSPRGLEKLVTDLSRCAGQVELATVAAGRLEPRHQRGTIRRILIRIGINAVALWAAAGIIDGITLEHDFWKVLLVAAIFGIVNAVLKPLLIVLSIPFIVVTLGIALVVVNAVMLIITDALTDSLDVDTFGSALLGALVISVVSWTVGRLLPDAKQRRASQGRS